MLWRGNNCVCEVCAVMLPCVLAGLAGMVHGKKWSGGEARVLRHPAGQSVSPECSPWLCVAALLRQPLDRAHDAAACTQGTHWLTYLPARSFYLVLLNNCKINDHFYPYPTSWQKPHVSCSSGGLPRAPAAWFSSRLSRVITFFFFQAAFGHKYLPIL